MTLVAGTPLKLTPELLLKPSPLIVTTVPTAARPGDSPVTESVGVNLPGLAPRPAGVATEIVATAAPLGTVASTCVGESTVNVAVRPPKVT